MPKNMKIPAPVLRNTGESRQQARARWRRAGKEARYSDDVRLAHVDGGSDAPRVVQREPRNEIVRHDPATLRTAAALMAAALWAAASL